MSHRYHIRKVLHYFLKNLSQIISYPNRATSAKMEYIFIEKCYTIFFFEKIISNNHLSRHRCIGQNFTKLSTDITWSIEVLNSCKTIYGQIYHFSLIPIKRIQTPYLWLWTKFYSILEYQIFRQLYSKFSLINILTIKKYFPWKKMFADRIDQSYHWNVFVNKNSPFFIV
mgnify:CR=1 FL=1